MLTNHHSFTSVQNGPSKPHNESVSSSLDFSRNVNSFKMKGMSSLISNPISHKHAQIRSHAGTPAALLHVSTKQNCEHDRKGSQKI